MVLAHPLLLSGFPKEESRHPKPEKFVSLLGCVRFLCWGKVSALPAKRSDTGVLPIPYHRER